MPSKVLEGDDFKDPSNLGPRKSHEIPSGGKFSIYCSTKINAPPQAVYDTLLDCNRWQEWNSFVHNVRITKHPHTHEKDLKMMEGTCMKFYVHLGPENQPVSKEVCTHVGKLKTRENHAPPAITRIRWSLDNANSFLPSFLLKAERTNEIEEMEDGTTEYRTWEVFGGLVAGHVLKKHGQALKVGFRDFCEDMKNHIESGKHIPPVMEGKHLEGETAPYKGVHTG